MNFNVRNGGVDGQHTGTAGNNGLSGTTGNDDISGLSGNDTISTLDGADTVLHAVLDFGNGDRITLLGSDYRNLLIGNFT